MTQEEIIIKLKEDIQLRGLGHYTLSEYTHKVRLFQNYFNTPADQMGEKEIREFLLHITIEKKLTNGSVNTYNSALRFLYGVTLNITLNLWQIPRLKQSRRLPKLLNRKELQLLFDNAPNLMYKAMFMTIYGSGLRVSEATGLKVSDVDSQKMLLFIREGKGDKDRFATLSYKSLDILREYWKVSRPTDYLFISRLGKPMSSHAVNDAFHSAMRKAGINKNATIHTLRHCFATHLLQNDTNLFHIKQLLGHSNIRSTAWYLHYATGQAFKVASPLDTFGEKSNG